MRKALALLILILSTGVLMVSMNQAFINGLKQARYFYHLEPHPAGKQTFYQRFLLRSDRWDYGDLYGLCYLPGYRYKIEPFKDYEHKPNHVQTNKILYIIGDSYLADKQMSGAFDSFDDVKFLDRRFAFGPITLDSTKQNYLIMEFAERNLIDYSQAKTAEILWSKDDIKARNNFKAPPPAGNKDSPPPLGLPARIMKIIFNKDLSRNLELLLFDDKAFSPLKKLKASLNYNLLGRLPKEVAVSTKKERLLMNITVDTSYRQSAFRVIPDAEIIRLSDNLEAAQNYYKAIGFKQVYLSVVPNAVSVYDKQRMPYNHLLDRIEQRNQFPVIPVYQIFGQSKSNLYSLSDTHWNPDGFSLWVTQANKIFNVQLSTVR